MALKITNIRAGLSPDLPGNNQIDTSNITKLKNTMRITILTLITSLVLLTAGQEAFAQRYVANDGFVRFFSGAAIEDIEATNEKTQSIFDAATGDIAFIIPIKEFVFDKNLMRQHFNENYMHTEEYPEATFAGKMVGFEMKEGTQEVTAKGTLTIHGISHDVEHAGTVTVTDGQISMEAKFPVKLEDYDVERPKLLWKNIAEVVEVTVALNYKTQ